MSHCSFIVSFSFSTANPENDGKRLQDFLLTMETSIRDHPLWDGASEEEIDSAIEVIVLYAACTLLFHLSHFIYSSLPIIRVLIIC